MDKNVRVRFHEVVALENGGTPFEDVLRTINGKQRIDRQKGVAEGCVLRLEELVEKDDLVIGDLTRVQSENLPSQVDDDDVKQLSAKRIGHHVAFCYDPETRIVAIQFHPMSVSVSRFCLYASHFGNKQTAFAPMPVVRQEAWDRFGSQNPRKMTLKVGRIENFSKLPTDDRTAFEDQISDWANRYDAPSVEITITARRNGKLNPAEVRSTIRRWLRMSQSIQGVKKVQAETIEADDAFNFLKELLQEKSVLTLPENQADARSERMKYVRECYDKHSDELKQEYVAANGS